MESVDAGTISKGGKSVHVTFRRTVHGPVYGYAKARGTNKQVALSTRRSSYGRETVDQLFFQQMTYGRVHSANDFIRAAYKTPQTFNSFYASTNESAFITSGRLPLRPKGVNPDLPVNGEGKYEWTGYLRQLGRTRRSSTRRPATSSTGTTSRPRTSRRPTAAGTSSRCSARSCSPTSSGASPSRRWRRVLAAANAAATEDVRIVELWPTLKQMLDRGKAPNAADQADRRPAAGLARRRRQPPRRRPRRQDRRPRRADPRRRVEGPHRRRAVRPPRQRRCASSSRGATGASTARPAASTAAGTSTCGRTCARMLGQKVRGAVPPALLRRRRREDVLEGAVGGAGHGAQALAGRRAPTRPRGARPRRKEQITFAPLPLSPCSTRTSRPASTR